MDNKTPLNILKEEHIKAALVADKGIDAHLDSWMTEYFTNKADNYSSTIVKVRLKFHKGDNHYQQSYVIKLNVDCHDVLFLETACADFMKESGFYLEILPSLISVLKECGLEDLRVPCCFFTSLEKGKELIILEDLRKRKFEMHNRKISLDVAHTNLVLQEVAKLHASSHILQKRTTDSDLRVKYDKFLKIDKRSRLFIDKLILMSVENSFRVLHEFGGYEKAEEWIKRNRTNCTDLMYEQFKGAPPFDVICQGDCWSNNFLFRYDECNKPVEVMLLDFQDIRHSSLATELNELMYTSLDGITRKNHIASFLATYYTAFQRVIEASGSLMPFTLQELHEEYKRRLEIGLLLGLVTVPWMVCGDEGLQWYEGPPDDEAQKEEFQKALKVRTIGMLEADPALRQRFLSLFDDMIESGIM